MTRDPRIHDEQLLIGASWYPEMWPETEWPKDIARMKEIGFSIVRLFEFAWKRFEPEEGCFEFDWALRVMDLLADAGLQAMVGTPTAAPPAWLTSAHPDVLRVREDGTRMRHGKRRHYSPHSKTYRRYSRAIVERMAEVFCDHPALHSWQIDNEIAGSDFGPEARADFRRWLEERYGDVETLNRTWGLDFWSQAYDRFDQVPMPVAQVGSIEVPERDHPSLIFAVTRCRNDAWSSFIAEQCEAIRARSEKPITTNMTSGLGMNWFQHNRMLDRVGHSIYKDVEHYLWNTQAYDRMRAEKDAPYWLLETAPNWSGGGRIWNIHNDERGIHNMTWMSVLMGGSMVLYWQWRQHWAGQEMQHGTHVTATGRWRPGKEAWAKLASDFRAHGDWLLKHPPARADVALMLSNEAAWAFSIDPIDVDMQYQVRWRDDYYLPLQRNHIWRDVIHESADFSRYKVICVPLMPMLSEDARKRLADWVTAGGRLILGPLTGYRSTEFTCHTDREFGGLEDLIGGESALRFPAQWVEDDIEVRFEDGGASRTRVFCDAFNPIGDHAEVLAGYRGGYGDGLAAVLCNKMGSGAVLTLGCMLEEESYVAMVRRMMGEVGVEPVASGSGDVLVAPRADANGTIVGYGVVNLRKESRVVNLPSGGRDLLSGRDVPAEQSLAPLEIRLIRVE